MDKELLDPVLLSAQVACPICFKMFPLIDIEAHSDACVDSSDKPYDPKHVQSFADALHEVERLGKHIEDKKVLALLESLRAKYEQPLEEDWVAVRHEDCMNEKH
jgi:hypothetical protein